MSSNCPRASGWTDQTAVPSLGLTRAMNISRLRPMNPLRLNANSRPSELLSCESSFPSPFRHCSLPVFRSNAIISRTSVPGYRPTSRIVAPLVTKSWPVAAITVGKSITVPSGPADVHFTSPVRPSST